MADNISSAFLKRHYSNDDPKFAEFLAQNPDVNMDDYAESGELSLVTQRMLAFYKDPIPEYQQKYGVLASNAIDMSQQARWAKYLPDTVNELQRVSYQGTESIKSSPGYCKIGTVELSIPPIQIAVNDIKNNFTYQTLRTNSDMTFTSGHTNKIVEMDVYFNGVDDINSSLRPLLAQLKATPLIPIDNNYIKSIVYPNALNMEYRDENNDIKNIAEEISKVNSDIDLQRSEYLEKINNLKGIYKNEQPPQNDLEMLSEDINRFFKKDQSLDRYNYFTNLGTSLSNNVDAAISAMANIKNDPTTVNRIINATKLVSEKTEDLNINASTLFSKVYPNLSAEENMVGVLSQMTISTVAGYPETLHCHFTFFVFNYYPFSQKFEFIKWNNEPTLNIDECEYFIKWYSDRFLSNKSKNTFYLEPVEEKLDGRVEMSYEFELLEENEKEKVKSMSMYFSIETDDNNVCSAVTVSNKNNIAMLPVLAWSNPTCQYMGRNSAEVLLSFDVSEDSFVEKIKFFSEVADLSSRINAKDRRNNFIKVDNELLRLNGIRNAVIQSVDTTTVPGSPGLTRVNIRLIEFDVKQGEAELITIAPGATKERMIALFDVAFSNLNGGEQTDDFPVFDALEDTLMISDSKSELKRQLLDNQRVTALQVVTRDNQGKDADGKATKIDVANKPINLIGMATRTDTKPLGSNTWYGDLVGHVTGAGTISAGIVESVSENIFGGKEKIKDRYQDVRVWKKGEKDPQKWDNAERAEFGNKIKENMKADISKISDDTKSAIMEMPEMQDKWTKKTKDAVEAEIQGRETPLSIPRLSDQQIKALKEKELYELSSKNQILYPDMVLPQYGDLPFIERPSYSKLGVRPPKMVDSYKFTNRVDKDFVEPDFYFYTMELKKYTAQGPTYEGVKSVNVKRDGDRVLKRYTALWDKIIDSSHWEERPEYLEDEEKMARDITEKKIKDSQIEVDDLNLLANQFKNLQSEQASRLMAAEDPLREMARRLMVY